MIIMLGDIHGRFYDIKAQIDKNKLTDCIIIQVGDFGIGSNPDGSEDILRDLDKFMRERNIIFYAIRGNHDDPYYFKGKHMLGNLNLVPDYTQMEIDGHSFLFVGGATSVDRKVSLSKMQASASVGLNIPLYWFDEPFVLDKEKLKDIKGVEVVITHTAPEYCYPDNRGGFGDFVQMFADHDSNLLSDLTEERTLVTEMFRILASNGNDITNHFYGHFHRSEITINGAITHQLLGINEMIEIKDYRDYEQFFNDKFI